MIKKNIYMSSHQPSLFNLFTYLNLLYTRVSGTYSDISLLLPASKLVPLLWLLDHKTAPLVTLELLKYYGMQYFVQWASVNFMKPSRSLPIIFEPALHLYAS